MPRIFFVLLALTIVGPIGIAAAAERGKLECHVRFDGALDISKNRSVASIVLAIANRDVIPLRVCVVDNWRPILMNAREVVTVGDLYRNATRPVTRKDFPIILAGKSESIEFDVWVDTVDDKPHLRLGDRFGGVWELGRVDAGEYWLCLTSTDPMGNPLFDDGMGLDEIKRAAVRYFLGPTDWCKITIQPK